MSKKKSDRSALVGITFDKSSAELVLQMLGIENAICEGCGKAVTRNSLGAVAKIKNKPTVWHSNIICLMAYIKGQEVES